ncbi:unnamed protein product, partial [Prorocentrum cordatum]
ALPLVVKSVLSNLDFGYPSDTMFFACAIADAGSKFWSPPESASIAPPATPKTARATPGMVKRFMYHKAAQIACVLSEASDVFGTGDRGGPGHDAAVAASLDALLDYVKKHSSAPEASAQSDSKFLACDGSEMGAWTLHWAGAIISFSTSEFEKGLAPKGAGAPRMQAGPLAIADLGAMLGKKARGMKSAGASDERKLTAEFFQMETTRATPPRAALVANIKSMKVHPNYVHLAFPNPVGHA